MARVGRIVRRPVERPTDVNVATHPWRLGAHAPQKSAPEICAAAVALHLLCPVREAASALNR